jgi:hypothetical protein
LLSMYPPITVRIAAARVSKFTKAERSGTMERRFSSAIEQAKDSRLLS